MADQYNWEKANQAGYKTTVQQLSRKTIADGQLLNNDVVETLSSRDKYLLDSLNSVDASARSVYNTVNTNSANNWDDKKIVGYSAVALSSDNNYYKKYVFKPYAADTLHFDLSNFFIQANIEKDMLGMYLLDSFTGSYYNKATRTPNKQWYWINAFGTVKETQYSNSTSPYVAYQDGVLFNTQHRWGRGVTFLNDTSAKWDDTGLRMLNGQTYDSGVAIFEGSSGLKGISIGVNSYAKYGSVSICSPIVDKQNLHSDSSNYHGYCFMLCNFDNKASTPYELVQIGNKNTTPGYYNNLLICNNDVTATYNGSEAMNLMLCNDALVLTSFNCSLAICNNGRHVGKQYSVVNNDGIYFCNELNSQDSKPCSNGIAIANSKRTVVLNGSLAINNEDLYTSPNKSLLLGNVNGSYAQANHEVNKSLLAYNYLQSAHCVCTGSILGHNDFTNITSTYFDIKDAILLHNNATTNNGSLYVEKSLVLQNDKICKTYKQVSLFSNNNTTNGIDVPYSVRFYVTENGTNLRDFEKSLIIDKELSNPASLNAGSLKRSVLICSDPIKTDDVRSEGSNIIPDVNTIALFSDYVTGPCCISMYNSSGWSNSIVGYNSYANKSESISLFDSKVISTTSNNIAMWNSTAQLPDSVESMPVIALWDNKVIISGNSINGVAVHQSDNSPDGRFPWYGMTLKAETLYIV